MTQPIGYAALQIIPSVKGIEGNLASQLGGPLVVAGRKAGMDAGAAIADGIERAKANVEKATATLAKAQDKVADATGRVRVETQKLTDAQNNSKTTAGQLAAIEERLESAVRKEAAAKRDAAKHTDALARANKAAADAGRSISSEVDRTTQKLDGLRGAAAKAGTAISDGLSKVGGKAQGAAAGGELGDGIMSGVTSKVSGLGGKAGPIGAALVGIAGVGLAAGAVLAGAIADGMEQQQDRALVQARLGVSDAAMKNIGQAAGGAFSNAWGESVSSNMSAAQVAIQSGLLDPNASVGAMQPVIEKLSLVSELMGEDIPAVSRAAGQAIKTGMSTDAAGAMDLFVKAQQNGLNVSGDFLDTMTEYGTQFRKLGLDGPEAFALVSQAVKNGARDTDVAADALKEFSIRASDGSSTTIAAFQSLGLNAEDMGTKFASGGTQARDALGQVMARLREMPPSVEKNQIAFDLFGTQSEDLGAALNSMNLDTAAAEFGQVAGAADAAADLVGNTAAAKLQAAKNSITTSMDGVKLAMADAFAPALGKLADWVTTHKPEIIGFFTALGDTVLGAADMFLSFSSTTLRVLADLNSFLGSTVGNMIGSIGQIGEAVGGIVKHIPGMGDVGRAMETAGQGAQSLSDKMKSGADRMRGLADSIDNTARPAIQGVREDFVNSGTAAQNSQILMRALGDSVTAIPNGKTITLQDNTPEATARLEALGLKVTTLPDGTVQVTANTAEGQAVIDGFVNQNASMTIKAYVALQNRISAGDLVVSGGSAWASKQADGGIISSYANGKLPSNALIQPAVGKRGLVQWAEGETKGEAFIPLAPEKRERSTAIWMETGRRLGGAAASLVNGRDLLGMLKMADGGIVDSILALGAAKAPGLQVTSTHRPGANDYHGAGQAVDFSNSSGNTNEQLAWANYLADNYRSQLAELIYDDPRFGRQIKDGQFVSDDFYAEAGDHTNHVHVAGRVPLSLADMGSPEDLSKAPPANAVGAAPAPDTRTDKQKNIDAIVAEGKRRGMSDKQIKSAVMTTLAETGGENLNYGDRDSVGTFQQRDNGAWGTLEDRMDPTRASGMYYDQLAKLDPNSMSEAQLAQAVQRSAFADGSNYQAQSEAADKELAESYARSSSTPSAPSGASASALTSGVVQDVRVTNWPNGSNGSTSAFSSSSPSTPNVDFTTPPSGFSAAPSKAMQAPLLSDQSLQQPLPTPGGEGAAAQFGATPSPDGEPDKFGEFFADAGQQWQGYFQDNWKEMLNTSVGLLLGGGRGGGGDTYNISGDPRTVATAIARQQARRTRALQLGGGMGR